MLCPVHGSCGWKSRSSERDGGTLLGGTEKMIRAQEDNHNAWNKSRTVPLILENLGYRDQNSVTDTWPGSSFWNQYEVGLRDKAKPCLQN